jgi:hypothetical protein
MVFGNDAVSVPIRFLKGAARQLKTVTSPARRPARNF